MDPDEIEFLAEKELISIVPTFNEQEINLITGDVGPFIAGLPVNVPLWMALNLKQQQKCKICCPDWMEIEILEKIKTDEISNGSFQKMPSEHYIIISKLLLGFASDDIPRADEIRTLIKDIWDIRMSKIRSSMMDKVVKDNPDASNNRNTSSYASVSVEHLTLMEINSIRPFLPHTLDQIYRIKITENQHLTQSLTTTTFSHMRNSSSFI